MTRGPSRGRGGWVVLGTSSADREICLSSHSGEAITLPVTAQSTVAAHSRSRAVRAARPSGLLLISRGSPPDKMGREQQEACSIFPPRSSEDTVIKGKVAFVKSRGNLKENRSGHGYLFIFVWVSGAVWPAAIQQLFPALPPNPSPHRFPNKEGFLNIKKKKKKLCNSVIFPSTYSIHDFTGYQGNCDSSFEL